MANWKPFEVTVSTFLKKGAPKGPEQFAEMLSIAYIAALAPINVKYNSGTTPSIVLQARDRRQFIKDGILETLQKGQQTRSLTPKDFLPAATNILKFWTPGMGVKLSPLPAPAPAFAPVAAGFPVPNDQWEAAMKDVVASDPNATKQFGGDPRAAMNTTVQLDPIVIFPSPIVLFPGNPLSLANDLCKAMTKSRNYNQTAKNLARAFQSHLGTIRGMYIGFQSAPVPIVIVPFNGLE